tara:strand:+ start:518 stop:1312 length:795 start_codon:yes stop_codon:yes gene_type:complete
MSTITVTNLQGHTSGGDANKVKLASGQTLDVNGTLDVTGSTITGNLPAANLTGALPALDGSALTDVGSMVKLAHTTVAPGSAVDYPFNFTSVFSSTYNNYFFTFTIATGATGVNGQHFYCQFGNGGTYVTASNAVRGGSTNFQLTSGTVTYGSQNYLSVAGIHQLNGTLTTTENGMFTGTGVITNPFSSYYPVQVQTKCIMQYFSTEANSWGEEGYSREDNGDKASYTDVRFGIIQGNSAFSGVGSNATRRVSYGHMTIYGMVD